VTQNSSRGDPACAASFPAGAAGDVSDPFFGSDAQKTNGCRACNPGTLSAALASPSRIGSNPSGIAHSRGEKGNQYI